MASLATKLRNDLGRAIRKARREAEAGARKALESLAVERREPHDSMTPEQVTLRKRLRAHGRQLGDARNKAKGTQTIDRLAHEVAYEHWHRMLFARFLAENHLLIEPESGVAISMAECDELARESNEDPLALAARFAQDSLPQIFRAGDPVLDVTLAPETRQTLYKLLNSLTAAVFTAEDSLGWTYQYWQTEKKDAVNESGNKIGADELPAVTQLFTEHYMVLFLYHNTIGAWHAGKVLAASPSLAETAQSEEELRLAVRLQSQGGYDFEYLRFVREPREGDEEDAPTGPWRPAAGIFEGWPKTAKEVKILDPCCGSGHFLIEGFELVVRLRMDEEGLGCEDAIRSVLADNLHGLELDPRCTQIAAFNLAMAAWKMAGKPIELLPLHIACSGLALGSTKTEWTKLAGDDERLRAGMERLYDLFEQAPELGSLIDPKGIGGDLLTADFAELQPLLEQALVREADEVEDAERAVAAQGMARAAELLAGDYTLVITNVPYLGRGQQGDLLKDFTDEHYKEAKADLATVFVERMLRWLGDTGTVAAVTPQNWLAQVGYTSFREKLLKGRTWNLVARLGEHAFQSSSAAGAFPAMVALSAHKPDKTWRMAGVDVSAPRGTQPIYALDKATLLRGTPIGGIGHGKIVRAVQPLHQAMQLKNPGVRITLTRAVEKTTLAAFATALHGQAAGDNTLFNRHFWEVNILGSKWMLYQCPPTATAHFCGRHSIVLWEEEKGVMAATAYAVRHLNHKAQQWRSGKPNWDKLGVAINMVGALRATIYSGDIYSQSCCVIAPEDPAHLIPLWKFATSGSLESELRRLDPGLAVSVKTVISVPFDPSEWEDKGQKLAEEIANPQSDDPTQWLFHGHPTKAEPATILQVAVGRLIGYRWPPEHDSEMRLADEAREWVARCDALKELADKDGIVCLSATRGERSAADRLRELLSAAYGSDWCAATERELLRVAGDAKKPASSLDVWLRNKFFEEHCKLFHHRPFIWHIWDGNRDGFHCLVNAHKLTGPDGEGRRTLEAITYSYLGRDWIDRQTAEQQEGKEGADARLAAAQDLQGQLEKILEGEPPYDLFIRWKPLHKQAIGWEPDINDGVRLNIRPFMKAELRKGGKKGAGILRWKPNIKWNKDGGKELQSLRPKTDFPWFWSCPGDGTMDQRTDFGGDTKFDGNRWKDLHYNIGRKQAARDRSVEEAE